MARPKADGKKSRSKRRVRRSLKLENLNRNLRLSQNFPNFSLNLELFELTVCLAFTQNQEPNLEHSVYFKKLPRSTAARGESRNIPGGARKR